MTKNEPPATPASRWVWRPLLILSSLTGSWYGMMAVHETGHVLAAWATGGIVSRVVLHPLTISRTDLDRNPSPLLVCWAGPVGGVLIPAVGFGLAAAVGRRDPVVARFFLGFCLIANGAYVGVGWVDRVGDAGDLLRYGASTWHLVLFGLLAVSAGLWAWDGVSPAFGLGPKGRPVSATRAVTVMTATVLLIGAGFLLGSE